MKTLRYKITCFKKMCSFLGEQSPIVLLITFDEWKVFLFFFFIFSKTKCNNVHERSFLYPFRHTVTLSLQNIFFLKVKKLHIIDSSYVFFTKECTLILKTGNFWPQGLQTAALQQRYSPCQSSLNGIPRFTRIKPQLHLLFPHVLEYH